MCEYGHFGYTCVDCNFVGLYHMPYIVCTIGSKTIDISAIYNQINPRMIFKKVSTVIGYILLSPYFLFVFLLTYTVSIRVILLLNDIQKVVRIATHI